MIFIGLGANLPSSAGPPLATCLAALGTLQRQGAGLLMVSPWYETAPVPASDQPWFVNGVAAISWTGTPEALLKALHDTEAHFGRSRNVPNAARSLDLDLLDFNGLIQEGPPVLPHPRLHERAFVLLPLRDLAPDWRHPGLGLTAAALAETLPPQQGIRLLADAAKA